MGETSGEDRVISHEELCKYDGVFMFGGFIKKPFLVGCDCGKSGSMHCEDSMLIEMQISRSFGFTSFYKSLWNPAQKYEASLPCSKLEQHARAPTPTIPSESATPGISSQRDIDHKIDGLLMKKLVQPCDPEFAENLAYVVSWSFGDEYKLWLDRNKDKGAPSKGRQWVQMWRSHQGDKATTGSLIEAL